MKTSNFENPLFVFLICFSAVIINIVSSVYFFPILFIGLLFMAFFISLKKRYYNTLFMIIFTILLIELNNGFRAFSLVLICFFMYVFIAPYIKRVLSFNKLNPYIYITFFYVFISLFWLFSNEYSSYLYFILLINLIIDLILFGIFI